MVSFTISAVNTNCDHIWSVLIKPTGCCNLTQAEPSEVVLGTLGQEFKWPQWPRTQMSGIHIVHAALCLTHLCFSLYFCPTYPFCPPDLSVSPIWYLKRQPTALRSDHWNFYYTISVFSTKKFRPNWPNDLWTNQPLFKVRHFSLPEFSTQSTVYIRKYGQLSTEPKMRSEKSRYLRPWGILQLHWPTVTTRHTWLTEHLEWASANWDVL